MAKINFEMDTVEKTFTLTIDGKPLENVCSLTAYMDYPYDCDCDGDEDYKCSVSIQTHSRDDDECMRQYTQICAADLTGVKIVPAQKPVVSHIANFIAQNRKR